MKTRDKLIIFLLIFSAFAWFLYSVSSILAPFIVGLIIAYFLDPLVDKFDEKFKLSRPATVAIITILFFTIIVALCFVLLPILYKQLIELLIKIPEYVVVLNERAAPHINKLMEDLGIEGFYSLESYFNGYSQKILEYSGKLLNNIWLSSLALINIFSLIFVTPVVAFYMLRDWDKIVKKVDQCLPTKYKNTIREELKKVDCILSAYVRGQINVCLILGVFYAISLTIAGLDFGLFIGILSGILAFIPYVGAIFGFIIGISVAMFQWGFDVPHLLIISGIFIIGQTLEGNFISPKLIGDKVGLHPVWIIFGLFAGGALMGVVGVLLAMPITAALGVVVRFFVLEYKKKFVEQEISSVIEKPSNKEMK